MRRLLRPLSLAAIVLLAAAQALPVLKAPVNDFAGVIDPASAAELDRRIRALETATHDAVVVVTVKTHAPYATIEEYALRLFEQAGIGRKDKDTGVLIVLAQQERRVRIEVGYGIEEFITDGFAGETIRQQMLPEFRQGRFGAGLLAGTTRIINRIAEKRGIPPPAPAPPAPIGERDNGRQIVAQFVAVIALLIIAALFMRRRGPPTRGFRRRSRWGTWSGWTGGVGGFGGGFGGFGGGGGGGGGGSFGGFGGGSSGGGGASGSW